MAEETRNETKAEILAKIPPAGPFVVPPERLAQLDADTRNAVLEEQVSRQAGLRVAIKCAKHTTRKCIRCENGLTRETGEPCTFCRGVGRVPFTPPMAMGCAHVTQQDEVHPVGIVLTPKRYYVCRVCWDRIQRRRFNFASEIGTRCWQCIADEAERIRQINPTLNMDLTAENGGG